MILFWMEEKGHYIGSQRGKNTDSSCSDDKVSAGKPAKQTILLQKSLSMCAVMQCVLQLGKDALL